MEYLNKIYFISGLGIGLAFLISQQNGINTSISSIGSPNTNVTVAFTNNNSPTIVQSQTVTASAVNTNSDNDQITQSNSVSVTNTNNNAGRSWTRRKRRAIIEC